MIKIPIFLLLPLLFVAGCATDPARWAELLEQKLECGMAIEEVQAVAKKRVKQHSGNVAWATHEVQALGNTEMDLAFEDGKLRYMQIAWGVNYMQIAKYPRVDLCTSSDGERTNGRTGEIK